MNESQIKSLVSSLVRTEVASAINTFKKTNVSSTKVAVVNWASVVRDIFAKSDTFILNRCNAPELNPNYTIPLDCDELADTLSTCTPAQNAVINIISTWLSGGSSDPVACAEVLNCLQNSGAVINEVLNIVNTALATSPSTALSNLCSYINDCIDDGLLVVSTDAGNLIETGIDGGAFLSDPTILNTIVDNTTEILNDDVVFSGSDITLPTAPLGTKHLQIYRNGLRLQPTADYTLSGNTITLVIAPRANDIRYIIYL